MRNGSRNLFVPAGMFAAAMLIVGGAALAELGKVAIGNEMPDFTLTDYNGEQHSLSEYRGKVVVLEFMSQHCPWSRGAAPAIAALSKEYPARDVVFLGIDSHKSTTQADNKAYAERAGIPYPILRDEMNVYADAVGATRTPEMYVVDREGRLVYHGAFDNRKSPDQAGDENYVRQALDAVLSGQPIENPEVRAWGCTIQRVPEGSKRSTTD